MEQLFTIFQQLIAKTDTSFVRYLYHRINWNNRLIAIVGSRGVGKTTMLFQHIKQNYGNNSKEVLYASLDNLWFASHTLVELADEFHKNGGIALYLDEVHKYPNWSREIKNIYDSYPDMKIVFTGSSMLDIFRSQGDLSRRALKYTLYGLSFREYLEFEYGLHMEVVSLETLLKDHIGIATEIGSQIKPIVAFKEYLRYGYFPFYKEDKQDYLLRLAETVNTVIEIDLPSNIDIEYATILKIKKLYAIIAGLVPFTPNISQLAAQVGTTRTNLLKYLDALERARAVLLLDKQAKGLKGLVKPEKIYLGNTNYAYAFAAGEPDAGNLRETFFFSMLNVTEQVLWSDKTDFRVNDKYSFEIGGQNKGTAQIAGISDSFLAKDNIEVGYGNQIPLWLFGMMY